MVLRFSLSLPLPHRCRHLLRLNLPLNFHLHMCLRRIISPCLGRSPVIMSHPTLLNSSQSRPSLSSCPHRQ